MRHIVLMLAIVLAAQCAPAQTTAAPCAAPEARQFDFWVGDWNGSWKTPAGADGAATNHVERLMGGCLTSENFETAGPPFSGKSYSVYSPRMNIEVDAAAPRIC